MIDFDRAEGINIHISLMGSNVSISGSTSDILPIIGSTGITQPTGPVFAHYRTYVTVRLIPRKMVY